MVKVERFDPADYLRDREDMIGYLDEAAADEDPRMFEDAVKVVWRAMKKQGLIDQNADLDGPDDLNNPESLTAARGADTSDSTAADDHPDRERIPA